MPLVLGRTVSTLSKFVLIVVAFTVTMPAVVAVKVVIAALVIVANGEVRDVPTVNSFIPARALDKSVADTVPIVAVVDRKSPELFINELETVLVISPLSNLPILPTMLPDATRTLVYMLPATPTPPETTNAPVTLLVLGNTLLIVTLNGMLEILLSTNEDSAEVLLGLFR